MAPPIVDITGRRFGNLLVVAVSDQQGSNRSPKWLCICTCGRVLLVERRNLTREDRTVSCGCLRRKTFLENAFSRIQEMSIPEPNSGCWLWMGAVTRNDSYGTISFDGRQWKAHRLAFKLTYGPIPDGLYVCHRCDNPACVNPEHLFLGTHLDNMKDRDHKQRRRAPRGELNSSAKLADKLIEEVRSAAGTQTAIAERFGIHQTTVSQIKLRKTWAHLS